MRTSAIGRYLPVFLRRFTAYVLTLLFTKFRSEF